MLDLCVILKILIKSRSKMFQNFKNVNESRLSHLNENDKKFFVEQTGLPRSEIDRIFNIFDEKGYSICLYK
jgi:hypothetical protein